MEKGFSSSKYIKAQTKEIKKRLGKYSRLYLEIGGKPCSDGHASRVLPGYKKTLKLDIFKSLGNLEIIYCISAKDISSKRRLGDFSLNYKQQALRDLSTFKKQNLEVRSVVITIYEGEKKAFDFSKVLSKLGVKIYFHEKTKNYLQSPIKALNSYKTQPYVSVISNLVVVTGPSGNSGKMAVALNQLYHENKNKFSSGFAKFETFPIHNLPLNHPINIAYEAATADLQDKVMLDPHKKNEVNYNRDIKNFEILKIIMKGRKSFNYKSVTDMGINMAKQGIVNDSICRKAAINEIKRRYTYYLNEFKQGRESRKTIQRMDEIMKKLNIRLCPEF
ncbi:DUF1846 family protein [Candidatus Pacearchaeota archaeon]|nr:DUF1846 family protein [Candidatus Pacearchaeota archaeon]